jgi:hypothetical protein
MARETRHGGARGRERRRGGGLATAALVLVVPLSFFFLPIMMVLAVGLVPTLVAFVVDRGPERTAPLTVAAMNLVGVLPFAVQLWQGGHGIAGALLYLSDPYVWVVMYGTAAMGWGILFGVPPLVAAWIANRARARIEALRAEQGRLAAEWGNEVRGEVD